METARAAEVLREQGRACAALGSPMYAGLLARLADDCAAGGPTAGVLADAQVDAAPADDPRGSALALRLLAGVHALVLERRAGLLALSWPTVGGTWEPEAGADAVLRLLAEQPAEVRAWLGRPPQTNEVGRAAALVGGLLHLEDDLRLPVRVVELGASAGLNLLADRFALLDGSGRVLQGDPASGVRLEGAWVGRALRPWPGLRFVDPVGCDLHPVDPTTAQGRLALSAYVWPDQPARWERLRAALALAATHPPVVHRGGAAELLDGMELREGCVTVVWNSVVSQYLDADERARVRARIEQLGASATAAAPLAHLSLEPAAPGAPTPPAGGDLVVTLRSWPGSARGLAAQDVPAQDTPGQDPGRERVLGHAPAHGLPTTWT